MPGENFLKTAAYFEDRAKRSRRPEDKDRFLAVAKKFRTRADEARKRATDIVEQPTAPDGNECRDVLICPEPRTPRVS